jgi:hypothetical protein
MPAVSEKQRVVAAIAEHHPDKLYKRNRGMLSMNKGQLHDFAVKRADRNLKKTFGKKK